MKSTVVVYQSKSGFTEKYARVDLIWVNAD